MKIDEYIMNLNLVTSLNDRKDIFNYKNKDIKKDDIQISKGYYFVINKNNINKISQQSEIKTEKGDQLLFRIRKSKRGSFTIENPINKKMARSINNYNSLDNKLWYILKSNTNNNKNNNLDDYILNKNDIIKLGTSKYEVIGKYIGDCNSNDKNIKQNKYNINNYNNNSQSLFKITEIKDSYYSKQTEDTVCRICFGEESSIDNPKVSLCKCNDYIHYECLKKWIKVNIKKRNNPKKTVLSYFLTKFYCEVCLKPYPLKFKISGINKEYFLIDLKMPITQNYIVLESLGLTIHNNNLKVIHIIKLIDKEITFGKQNTCDIIDCGTYVSRIHAVFKYNNLNGDIILENKSKNFDTLVLIKNPIKINEQKVEFQVGRTIITSNLTKDKLNY